MKRPKRISIEVYDAVQDQLRLTIRDSRRLGGRAARVLRRALKAQERSRVPGERWVQEALGVFVDLLRCYGANVEKEAQLYDARRAGAAKREAARRRMRTARKREKT